VRPDGQEGDTREPPAFDVADEKAARVEPPAPELSAAEPPAAEAAGGAGGAPFAGVAPAPAAEGAGLTERPEVLVGAAFGGGLLLAILLRRLGS
jgi:hypothetical protein